MFLSICKKIDDEFCLKILHKSQGWVILKTFSTDTLEETLGVHDMFKIRGRGKEGEGWVDHYPKLSSRWKVTILGDKYPITLVMISTIAL